MMIHEKYVFLLITWLLPCMASAQYTDHRNRHVDSLEQVLATNPPSGIALLGIYNSLVWGYSEINNEKSKDYALKGVRLSEQLDNRKALTDFNGLLAMCYYGNSQYDSALFHYNKALEAAASLKTAKNSKGEPYTERFIDDVYSNIYGNMGNLFNIQGKHHEALEYYQKALSIFEKWGWQESQTIAHEKIGEMYRTMNNFEQATHYFKKMDSLAYVTGDSLRIATAKWYLSHLYLNTKEYDKALQNAELAYHYYFSHPEEEGENKAITLNLLSEIYLGGYDDARQAEDYARQALALLEDLAIPREKSVSLRILAEIHLKRGEWRKAEQTAVEALAADDSEPANTLAVYDILAKSYAKSGNSDKAWEYIDKLQELQSSWSNKNYQSAIREMEVKYETAKKELQIATLQDEKRLMLWLGIAVAAVLLLILAAMFLVWRWTVQKRRLAEQQVKHLQQEKQLVATQALLDGETRERSRLARDLHDGLGSFLAATRLNLLELKSALPDDSSVQCYDSALGLLEDSIREMRRIAHHLMPESLAALGLKQPAADFCRSIPHAKFNWYGNETRLAPQLEMALYCIMHELVNNALKHSGAGRILVEIVCYDESIALTVQDDGCGFDPLTQSKGMGLENIRTRVAAYNGNLIVDAKPGMGTEVNVEFQI